MNLYAKKQNLFWQKLLVGAAVLVVVIFLMNIFQKQTRNVFLYVSSPFSNAFLQSGKNTSQFFGSLLSFTTLQKENGSLKSENQNLLASLSQLQENLVAVQDAKTAAQNTQGSNFTLAQAKVIGLDVAGDTMLIDKGSANLIAVNMPVISKEKVLFGRVTKVYANFSQITLISNKKSALAVKIQTTDPSATPIYGAVKGSGSLGVYMDLISSNTRVASGNVLVTSAQEGIFPADLLVGKITSSNESDSKAFQTAKVQPFFDPKNTDSLFVITNYLKK